MSLQVRKGRCDWPTQCRHKMHFSVSRFAALAASNSVSLCPWKDASI